MLRTSGDVSNFSLKFRKFFRYAPHERRCFYYAVGEYGGQTICSARAEMFPNKIISGLLKTNMLRTSGDVSTISAGVQLLASYAPHERRCFPRKPSKTTYSTICSARAEMFLRKNCLLMAIFYMLRTSGDVSNRSRCACLE